MRLSEPIDLSGYFWLPGKPEQRLPGALYVSETGETTLEVIGVFGENVAALTDSTFDLPRVVGVVENGDLVTLEHCFYKSKNFGFGGISKSTIYANFFLRGVQYEEGGTITFSRFSFSLEGLDEWLLISGLRVEHNWKDKSASIHFDPPKEIVHQLPDGMVLAFTFEWTVPGAPIITEAKITQKAFITLKSESSRPLGDFLSLVFKINNFLCFAIDETVSIDSATCYSYEITLDCGDGKKREVPIRLYYQSNPLSDAMPKISPHNMLFRYGQVSHQLTTILNHWLSNYETSEPAFNLYFASKAGAHKYLEGRFLSLAQGIETLHRRNSQETTMAEAEFNELVDMLVKGCPPTKQKWLKKKMEYANELALRKRIRQMIAPFEGLYGDLNQRKHFVGKIIDTRNYLTHYDAKLSQQAAHGKDLWGLCLKLEALFQLHFLRLIGLDGSFITNLVNENNSLRGKLEP
jgi:hypothetical protein